MKSKFGVICIVLLACCRLLASEQASPSETLFKAIRAGDAAEVRTLVRNGADVRACDKSGDTPLMAASLYADAAVLEILLKSGADVNAANKSGATALMRAAAFEEKARLLVARHADVKIRSALGNTALILAARRHGNARTVELLLDQGAEINATNLFGATALMAATAAKDEDTVRLLLARGAKVNSKPNMDLDGFLFGGGRTPLMWAAFRGDEALIRLLLAHGANVNDFTLAGSALSQAAWAGNARAAEILLEAGAQVDHRDLMANFTPLHWAASSERTDPSLVKLLLGRGADANAEGGQPVDGFLGVAQTPLMLARKRGETQIVQALLKAGAADSPIKDEKRSPKPARPLPDTVDDAAVAAAIQLAVAPLQSSAISSKTTFLKHGSKQDCISCHQQELPLAALSVARSRHIGIDEPAVRKQIAEVEHFAAIFQDRSVETVFTPEPAVGNGYSLLSLRLEKQPATPLTDSQVHELAVIQCPDGRWALNLPRPPMQSSDVGATALAIQALKFYGIPGRQREFDQRIERARGWLAAVRPDFTEERVYQLLGLAWAGAPAENLKKFAEELAREQRPDGGWGQLATLPSDAFATGQSLYALLQSGAHSPRDAVVERGVRFLLKTQLEDGTWHVRRRAFPFQPPMDSGFPHGADGWLSCAGTSWAAMALASTLDPSQTPPARLASAADSKPVSSTSNTPAPAARAVGADDAGKMSHPVDFIRDIQPLLRRSCMVCHNGERAKGGYRMADRASLLRGGMRGDPVIVSGHSEQSPLIRIVSDQVEDLEMPPLGRRDKFPALTKDEVARLSAWIDSGAAWPESESLQAHEK